MATLTIRNLTNSPFDIEGGHRLPAMGEITAEFSDHYGALLRASPGVEVLEAVKPEPAREPAPRRSGKAKA